MFRLIFGLLLENLNKFAFQKAETNYGKISINVDYIPHVDIQVDSHQQPVLVLR
jgi:hypothetical protein